MGCEGAEPPLCTCKEDLYFVEVSVSTTFTEIVKLSLRFCYGLLCRILFCFIFIFVTIGVYTLLRFRCYLAPEIELQSMTIRNMTVTRTTNATADTQIRELNYDINITLSMHNPNTLPGCSIKYHRMVVSTAFRGDVLQQSYIPLAFSQKLEKTREVATRIQTDHVQLNQTNAVFFEGEVQNKNVLMEVYVDTRFRTSERKNIWNHVKCRVIVSTPSPSQALGDLMFKKCPMD